MNFMEIFQDGTFPDLEYHLFQVICVLEHLLGKFTVTNYTHSGNRHIFI